MAKLTFFGAISTIGGNCVILEEDGHRLMLDNGKCFATEGNFSKDFLKLRKGNGIRDYLELGLIPPIDGIYDDVFLTDIGLSVVDPNSHPLFKSNVKGYESYLSEHNDTPFIDGILISHAHLDHIRNLLFMDYRIPIYCSKITYDLFKIISDLSDDSYLKYNYPELAEAKSGYFKGELKKVPGKNVEREFICLEPNNPVEIGPFLIDSYPTDHSIPGSMAFKIKTTNGKQVVHTGDLRFHGLPPDAENTKKFVESISATPVDAFITEGTKIDTDEVVSEADVLTEAMKAIKKFNAESKLIIADFPWKNVSRFQTVYSLAKKLKRTFIILPKLAYVIHNLQNNPSLNLHDILHNDDLQIYLPRAGSMIYSPADYVYSKASVSYNVNWDQKTKEKYLYTDIYGEKKHIKAYEITESPEKYIVHIEFYTINQLIDIRPPDGSVYFRMKTEPFDDEGMIEQNVLQSWIDLFNLNCFSIHASGHASGKEIFEIIEKVNPKVIYPIHTEKPELFTMKNAVTKISAGKEYEV